MRIEKPSVAKYVMPGQKGSAKVEHFEVTKQDSDRTRLRASFGHPNDFVEPGTYARLSVNGVLMMTDTQFEWRSNSFAVRQLKGDALIGGLGIGMVLIPVLQKPDVKSVTVVEKYQDVIDVVLPSLQATLPEAAKLKVMCEDILTWKPPTTTKYDSAYFDIWPTVCEDNLEQMSKLKRVFTHRLNKGEGLKPWMGCWEEETLRYRRDRERRSGWGY